MGRRWKLMEAASELKQMAERRVVTRGDALAYLLRTKAILDSLEPNDLTEVEEAYARIRKEIHG
ncbi:MAG TPA: hypothetical protein VN785_12295 [Candidatus Angelobacter sp.]|nr:hypothetical protein [Candidatus Angelobacter sp.]